MSDTMQDTSSEQRPRLRVLVVDDEPLGRKRVLDLLARRDDVEVVAVAACGRDAVAAILEHSPDLVFLDVQMPDFSGIEVVRNVGAASMPPTIFVTAYDRHAIEAFELAAVDYLLKPFEDERFEQSLARARKALLLRQLEPMRNELATLLGITTGTAADEPPEQRTGRYLERITVDVRGGRKFVPVDRVEYITADGPYVQIHTEDQNYLLRERMTTLEEQLDPERFQRIHRSVIVRLDLIDAFHIGHGGDYAVQLRDGTRLKVSRAKRDELVERLKGG